MAIKAAEQFAPHWYTPAGQEGDESPTRFFVEPLTERERAGFQMRVVMRDGAYVLEEHVLYDIAAAKVADWENFPADSAEEFSKAGLKKVPGAVMAEIGSHIWVSRGLEADAEKNS